jgi:hypothetical protein
MNVEPYFQPFEGCDYRNPNQAIFPGRLLVLGESHYLRNPENDDRPDFTQRILSSVVRERSMSGWRTRYFRNVFYLLTGRRSTDVEDAVWQRVWQSLAFYNFVQARDLTRPLMRPKRQQWLEAKDPFRLVLARLRPEFVIITGRTASAYATSIQGVLKKPGVIGVWIPTVDNSYAFTRCVHHPSSRQSTSLRDKQRELVNEMLDRKWLAPGLLRD